MSNGVLQKYPPVGLGGVLQMEVPEPRTLRGIGALSGVLGNVDPYALQPMRHPTFASWGGLWDALGGVKTPEYEKYIEEISTDPRHLKGLLLKHSNVFDAKFGNGAAMHLYDMINNKHLNRAQWVWVNDLLTEALPASRNKPMDRNTYENPQE